MKNAATYQFSIPSAKKYLGDVRRFVEAYSLHAGFEAYQAEHIKIAVDEACTNIIEHAFHNDSNHEIQIVMTFDPKQVVVSLVHEGGDSFDPTQYKQPNGLRASMSARKGGGWGVFLMNKLMDKVEFRTYDDVSEVRLIKKRD